jgi:hypothetical protein
MRTRLLLFSFLLLLTSVVAAQKITVKDNLVSVDQQPVFKLVDTNIPNAITLYSLADQKLAVFTAFWYNDPRQITQGNPQGRVGYYEVTFLDPEMQQCEIRMIGLKKNLAQLILNEQLVINGQLATDKVHQFCVINGKKYSEERQRNNGTTIIINNH